MRYLLLILLLISSYAYAGDTHQRGESHRVVYVVTDSSGNPVTGETVRLKVQRVSDDAVLDFNDNQFKYTGWTTPLVTMNYNAVGEYYSRTISIDTALLVSGDYVCIVSNDSATYGDQQAEVIGYDSLKDIIRINR